jgi:hypothetical protein
VASGVICRAHRRLLTYVWLLLEVLYTKHADADARGVLQHQVRSASVSCARH